MPIVNAPKLELPTAFSLDPAELALLKQLQAAKHAHLRVTRTVTFDADAAGAALPSGSMLDSSRAYQAWGIAFSASSGHVYANHDLWAHTGSNVVCNEAPSMSNLTSERTSVIRATFASPAAVVSILAAAVTPLEWYTGPAGNFPYLKAYDASGRLLGQAAVTAAQVPTTIGSVGGFVNLTVMALGNLIAYAEFSCPGSGSAAPVKAVFDDLSVQWRV